jgi:transposase InsO family protein
LTKLFLTFGIPKTLISDNGSNFVSNVTKDLMSFLNVEKLVTFPYHPQAHGKIENRHKMFSNV